MHLTTARKQSDRRGAKETPCGHRLHLRLFCSLGTPVLWHLPDLRQDGGA